MIYSMCIRYCQYYYHKYLYSLIISLYHHAGSQRVDGGNSGDAS